MENHLNITEEEWNEMDAYLQNRLDKAAMQQIQQRMEGDPAYRAKMKAVEELSLGIEEAGVHEHLRLVHQQAFPSTRKPTWVASMTKWVAAACVLVLVTASVFYWVNRDNTFQHFYKPDVGLPTYMGATDNYTFDKAMIDYKTGEFDMAIQGWKQLLAQNPGNDTLHYFIGSALLADKRAREAIPYFDQVMAQPQSAFVQDAQWYKALALIKDGKKAEAVALLQKTEHEGKSALLKKLQ